MIPKEITEIKERFFRQAFETVYENIDDIKEGYTLNAFNKRISKDGICPTITTRVEGFKTAVVLITKIRKDIQKMSKYRIRKLTPTECFRLQGMDAEEIAKCRAMGISDSKLYFVAGNGLTTTCPQFIAEHLYKATVDENYETTDEKMSKLYGVAE